MVAKVVEEKGGGNSHADEIGPRNEEESRFDAVGDEERSAQASERAADCSKLTKPRLNRPK